MEKRRYRCIVCGRVFPRGQGIVIKHGNLELAFHSSRCASKFLRKILENSPEDTIGRVVRDVYEEFLERIKVLEERRTKKI